MNKDNKIKVKKSFVRNTEQIKPKTIITTEPAVEECLLAPSIQTESSKAVEPIITLNSPKENSVLKIAKAIESLQIITQPKISTSNLDKKKRIVIDEKASKRVNFPYNQPIYKDLIPLCTVSKPKQFITVKQFNSQRDKEPLLSDFYTPKRLPEYSFEASTVTNHTLLTRQFDAFKIYRTITNWN